VYRRSRAPAGALGPAGWRTARARVEAEYDIEKLNDSLEALYRSV